MYRRFSYREIITLMVEFERVRHKRKPDPFPSSTSTTSKLVIRSSELGSSFGQTAARIVEIPNEGIHRTLHTKNSSQAALVNRYFPHFDHEASWTPESCVLRIRRVCTDPQGPVVGVSKIVEIRIVVSSAPVTIRGGASLVPFKPSMALISLPWPPARTKQLTSCRMR